MNVNVVKPLAGCSLLLILMVAATPGWATEQNQQPQSNDYRPWSTLEINLGGFLSKVDTGFRIGSGAIGLEVDAEDTLDLDESITAFRVEGSWRYTESKRHRVDFHYFSMHRDATITFGRDWEYEDEDGNSGTIPLGTQVETYIDLDVYRLKYEYSFLQDERVDFAAGLGLYVMPISFGVKASGFVEESTSESITAPLPVLGIRGDVALTPDWYLRSGVNFLYLEVGDFSGSIMQTNLALEYCAFDNWALGMGYDNFRIQVEGRGDDYPNIDLHGKLRFEYTGLQLYLKYFL